MVKLWKSLPGVGGEVWEGWAWRANRAFGRVVCGVSWDCAVRLRLLGQLAGWDARCQHVVKRLKPDDVRHVGCRVRERKGARCRLQRTNR